jgi:glutamate synthase (NADPH) large chain
MMRVCHLDTCPVGIATQNPELRKRFTGQAQFVVNFFEFIAEEVRELLADLGFRSIEEVIGHPELIDLTPAVDHWKAHGLDLTPILHVPDLPDGAARRRTKSQDHGLEAVLDRQLIEAAKPALEDAVAVTGAWPIRNVDRTTGTLLGAEVTRRYGAAGLPDDTIHLTFTGSAGQSFGAFLPRGITLRLIGDANDYVGKGLSGGRLVVRPSPLAPPGFVAEEQIIAGNVILYGATAGELYLRGVVGERFAVRNSGATAVVEGVGDHACEYMTGGRVVVLGSTGRNFGAGMSGGIAYVWDPERTFAPLVNTEMVTLEALDDEDRAFLDATIRRHRDLTDSARAELILADWPASAAQFAKVMPIDYRRVLNAARAASEAGRSVDDAIMAAAHG